MCWHTTNRLALPSPRYLMVPCLGLPRVKPSCKFEFTLGNPRHGTTRYLGLGRARRLVVQCWYRISANDERAEQAIDEISSIDGCQISATDISHTTEINMEFNHWYRLAKRFKGPDEKYTNETVMKCATCGITNVLVSQQEVQTHCASSGDCMKMDVRDMAKSWKSSELHVKKDNGGNYAWIPTIDTQAEDINDDEDNVQI